MEPLNRRQFLTSLGAGAAALSLPLARLAPAAAASARRPNIVLILADDLGNIDLGCYGQTQFATPNIDRLAAEGTRFLSAYSGASVCAPSRCSLMTGRHMGHATIRGNWEVFPEGEAPLRVDDVTIAQILKDAGYATGLCGKWGLGAPDSTGAPNNKGFDHFFGYNCQRHAHVFYTDYLYRNTERIELPQSATRRTNAQDLIADESLNFIRENKDRPFFLFCAWTVPHGPYTADQVPSLGRFADKPWTEQEKVYAAMVERLDADVGRVMAQLKELNLDDNTLVLFASDNGANTRFAAFDSSGGRRGLKTTLYEGGLNVPMIARWPGRVPAGRTTNFVTAFWDFLPTFAELAGAAQPAKTDGLSIAPTLFGRDQKPHEYLYWEQTGKSGALAKAVRLGDWKAHQARASAPIALYNLKDDPAESKNVAAAHPDEVRKIGKIMTDAHTDTPIPKLDPRVWPKYQQDMKAIREKRKRP